MTPTNSATATRRRMNRAEAAVRPVETLVTDHEGQPADDHRPAQRVIEAAADPGQPDREDDDPEGPHGNPDHERTLRLRWPTQLQGAGPGKPEREGAGRDRGEHRGPLLSRYRPKQDRCGGATRTVGAIGHPDRGCPDRTAIARGDEGDGHGDDECGTGMPDETRRHEDRTGGHDQADEGCEQLDDETAENDRPGSPPSRPPRRRGGSAPTHRSRPKGRASRIVGSLERPPGWRAAWESRSADPSRPRPGRWNRRATRLALSDRRRGRRRRMAVLCGARRRR